MTVSAVVPVAVVASVGALATIRSARLAWTAENKTHRKLFLSLLLLSEVLNLLVPLGAFNHLIRTYQHRAVFALAAFLVALHVQEFLTFVLSYSKTWSIYAEYKSAGLLPEYFSYWQSRYGNDRLFKRPLFLIAVGLVLGFFLPPFGQIVMYLGVLWFAGIASFLARTWPEDRVLEKISKSWKLRIVLAVIIYLVVAPLVVRAVGIKFVEDEHSHEQESREEFDATLKENLGLVESFLTTYEGVAVAILLLVYKFAVLGTVGGIRRCGWNCNYANGHAFAPAAAVDAEAQPFNQQHYHYGYPAEAAQSEPLAPSTAAPAAPAPGASAPSAPQSQGYAFYA